IITAGNIESSSYSLTLCAERVALFSALSNGYREFTIIGVATDNGASPCGACRQLLWEFARDIQVILIDSGSNYREIPLADLLPEPFDDSSLHTST
ncbi:MAG: cytidine deaminase, partial [Candidatus Marinimicrobia bacterium]|nr:cytidine deaminase [Candidatus Neomarinimicrobiota bacterium]